jgi:hypothetical protein
MSMTWKGPDKVHEYVGRVDRLAERRVGEVELVDALPDSVSVPEVPVGDTRTALQFAYCARAGSRMPEVPINPCVPRVGVERSRYPSDRTCGVTRDQGQRCDNGNEWR